jgi:hypothetical protein
MTLWSLGIHFHEFEGLAEVRGIHLTFNDSLVIWLSFSNLAGEEKIRLTMTHWVICHMGICDTYVTSEK